MRGSPYKRKKLADLRLSASDFILYIIPNLKYSCEDLSLPNTLASLALNWREFQVPCIHILSCKSSGLVRKSALAPSHRILF